MFSAILITRDEAGQKAELAQLDEAQLPEGDVTIDVEYSTLNYKDGAAITGKNPVVRKYPMVPGVDLAGTVRESRHADWRPGDKVVLNCWGVGEAHWGGLAQKARVSGDWLIPLPEGMSTRQAMAIGTAGYTAALCVDALERYGTTPASGPILVTGASGGVGSVAIVLLARAGYEVAAVTGKVQEADYLKELGATSIIDRATLSGPGKPLQPQRWGGVIDTAGSHTLANACSQTRYAGVVAATGMAQGMDFPASVAPFILRGVRLIGVESVTAPKPLRVAAWRRLARDLELKLLDVIGQDIGLAEALSAADDIMAGKVRGRIVVDVNK